MEFTRDTFKILQFTDTHFGVLPECQEDLKTYNLIDRTIRLVDPDLIVHTGDIIRSEGIENPNEIFEKVMGFFDGYKIPLAITFGNHDSEDNTTRSELREIFDRTVEKKVQKKNSFIVGDRESYTVEIKSGEDLVSVLYIIDSGDYDLNKYGTYAYLYPSQVDRFRKTSEGYKKGDGVKRSIVFQHIPLPEYRLAPYKIISGKCQETNAVVSSPNINTGLFANMLLNGETWGISVGHDHENNFHSLFQGLHLVYGNSSGYNAYGKLEKGATVFEITKDPFEIDVRNIALDEN